MAAPVIPPVTADDVLSARELLSGVVRTTPVAGARALSDLTGSRVGLKCENLQRTGSFKIRGAYTRIARLSDDERAGGVVAASAGNHAQGVALAARLLGVRATVYMPERAALPKVDATRGYGAEVVLTGRTVDEAVTAATAAAERSGAVFVHPFDHPDIIAGQGTVGCEILDQVPDVGTVLISAGGGGLLGGTAAVLRAARPDIRIVGVQAAGAAAWPSSLAAGAPMPVGGMRTMADGIAVGRPGDVTFAQVSALIDEMVTVSEDALSAALLHCLERAKMLVEPAGAASVAALMEQPDRWPGPVVCVLSGGNVDPLVLLQVIRHGLVASSRYLTLHLRMPDRPGALAELLARVGRLGANVTDVAHSRIRGALAVGEVDVELSVETRGPEHRDAIVADLREAGHAVATP
ncbi:Threonine dehydratase [Pseudonocardia sp. Ae406_Ps2]|uniref:threonine ammonia-lyase n=1 Tax=unclassified Pseudonocardia TaxID=2619320 RepID=UPI00094ADC1E|nr:MULTISPECIES: threonine ammonia-lyase [unclassified Pseudonocardia]OLL99403.1 Threonine dehydratase [Pseudonocardia sp. Ae331_Ps2]OLM02855.1 Threonine dehydratase [Pseudonocardia sp. Ae406_Ps2]OLM12311.1 Threonine dehydratase [Pseudonocardia sp. Ae505_Ps2]OLM24434.1 Threonine dehydratase [Pseudonocardia sp. Ae706_Ps2]OLM29639.1 Threonine dehydratase [Pseudonocardia sp. Ae717_Ps2]